MTNQEELEQYAEEHNIYFGRSILLAPGATMSEEEIAGSLLAMLKEDEADRAALDEALDAYEKGEDPGIEIIG